MEGNSTGRRSDLDRTDKLPVLTQDSLVKLDSSRTSEGAEETEALHASIAGLREAIDQETQRSRALESRIETQDQALAELRAAFDRETEVQAKARDSALAAQQQTKLTRDLIGKVQTALRSLHKRIVTLETYIAGRPEGWREMEQALHAKTIRIAEAEAQLAETISRVTLDLTRTYPDVEASSDPDVEAEAEAPTETPADRESESESAAVADPETRSSKAPTSSDSEATLMEPPRMEPPPKEPPPKPGREVAPEPKPAALAEAASEPSSKASSEPPSDAPAAEGRPARPKKPALVGLTPNAPIACGIDKELITIGRDSTCDMAIRSHAVSRKHAVLLREGSQIVVEDRGSTNGVQVNAVRVLRQPLSDGDEVTIGDAKFRFVGGETPD
ncbi:MAG: FHA domain-containing protein [Gammaproteobacteria bacterium]|jgi:hypothetical protein